MSIALMLIITLSASAQGGRAIKFIKWPAAPAVVLAAVPWYEKVWNFIRDNMEAQICYRSNSVKNCCWTCIHRVNHFPNDKTAKWSPWVTQGK